jgi:hypothetical protein
LKISSGSCSRGEEGNKKVGTLFYISGREIFHKGSEIYGAEKKYMTNIT